ncbi:MAG: FHA domain-containing protein [Kiritimatiellae bacterium]|nr:FHA domain-containing protein [Kiritimatiellia bacterium]
MNDNPRLLINILLGPDEGKTFVLEDTCFLGRQEKCLVRLTDPAIEPLHARITLRGDSFTLTDLSGKNDLKVNNRLVKSIKLVPGDTINVGTTVIKIEEYKEKAKQEDDVNPRTEIVFVKEKREDDTLERIERPEQPRQEVVEEKKARKFVPETRRSDVTERKHQDLPPVSGKTLDQMPSMSGQSAVDAFLKASKMSAANKTRSRYIGLIVFLSILGVALAFFAIYLISTQRLVEKEFNDAFKFAEANPGSLNLIIERYKKLRNQSGWAVPKIRKYLDSEIEKLVAEVAMQEAELTTLLKQLDNRAADLVAKQAYGEAVDVYSKSSGKYRDRVLDLRKSAIENIVRQSADHTEKIKKQQTEKEQQLKAENEKRNKIKLDRILLEVVQSLVDGECDTAVKLLEELVADGTYAPIRVQADEALTTARLLRTIDRMQAVKAGNRPLPGANAVITNADPSGTQINLSPVISALLAIRKADPWEARVQLEKAKDHLLYATLLERTKMSDEELKIEKEAIRGFAAIWSTIVGKQVTTIPRTVDCITQWNDVTRNMSGEGIEKMSSEVKAYQKKYGKTMFVRKYLELFAAISASVNTVALAKEPVVIGTKGSGLGDGKIIQAEKNTFFVESDNDIPEGAGYSMGLFTEKTVFNIGTNKIEAARVNVRAALPFKVLSKKQASFSLPEALKVEPPVIGDRVLIEKDLQVGSRIISVLPKSISYKIFYDYFEGELTNLWKHAIGAAKIERGRLSIDRSSAVPDLLKKDEIKADLQLQLEIGSDPVKVDFDLLRKAEGGISVGIGDVEFLIGTVDGRKSGIYVKGNLVKPMVFMRPTSPPVPQRVVMIKGQSFAYVAVGKTSAECKVSPSVGESQVNRILFSCDTKISIDDVVVSLLKGSGGADIAAVSQDGREFLLSKGYENEWENMVRGQMVYVFGLNERGEPQMVSTAKVEGFISADKMLCTVTEGRVSGIRETGWLSPDIMFVPESKSSIAQEQSKIHAVHAPTVLHGMVESGKAGAFTVIPDMVGAKIDGEGFFCVANSLVINPETGEKLATWVGKEVRCEFLATDEAGRVKCRPPAGFPVSGLISNGVLLSRQLFTGTARIDLPGKMVLASVSAVTTKQPFWAVMNGDWKEKSEGISSVWNLKTNLPPMLVTRETFDGNVQYDLAVRVENEGKTPRDDWVKDLMVQLDFAGGEKGLTFAIGAGTSGGILVHGRTMGMKKDKKNTKVIEDIGFGRLGDLGANAEIKVE